MGADFNWYENIHVDFMLTHKLFLDELTSNQKLLRKGSGTAQDTNDISICLPRVTVCENDLKKASIRSMSISTTKDKNRNYGSVLKLEQSMIPNNLNSALFIKVLMQLDSHVKIERQLEKTSKILENIKEKIKVDGKVRPLKLFWVKADYDMVGRMCALVGTGIAFMLSSIIKSVDFTSLIEI